jgi:pimeloyl-ACP methyl ester carboxylesterase
MSWIGARFPNRIAALVYLDAAYDRSNIGAEAAIVRRIPPPPFSLQAFDSAQSLARTMSIPEAEVRQLAQIGPDGRLMGERTPPQVSRQIIEGIVKTDYPNLRAPVLAIYAKRMSPDEQPGCRGADDAAVRQACAELHDWISKQLSESQRLFRTIPGRVQIVELPGANTFVFRSNEWDVMQAIDRFVAGLGR